MLRSITAIDVRGERFSADVAEGRVLASVHRVLHESVLCSVSTVTPDQRAYSNIAYVAYTDDLRLCFLSHPNARHCHNVSNNPSMAISVYNSAQEWGGHDRGLQLFGSCRMAAGNEAASAAQVYGRRFAQYENWAASLTATDPGREYRFFWFTAEQLKVWDEQEFGDGVLVSSDVQR